MSKVRSAAGLYAMILGSLMVSWWTLILLSGQMLELQTSPIESAIHLLAEFLTAFTLILAGYGLLAQRWWGARLYLVSLGMLLYAAIQASAYYAQKREIMMIVLFLIIIASGLAVTSRFSRTLEKKM